MKTEPSTTETMTMLAAYAEAHQEKQRDRIAEAERAVIVQKTIRRIHPENMTFATQLLMRNMLINALECHEIRMREIARMADEQFNERCDWYRLAGLLPQTEEQPSERPSHGATAETGPDNEGQ